MPAAQRTSISAQRLLMEKRVIGWQLSRERLFRNPAPYSPTEAAINKSWKPNDIEKLD
jgi:hypothetical protein